MTVWLPPGWQEARPQARKLAEAIQSHGFTVYVVQTGGHLGTPCIVIMRGPEQPLRRTVYVYDAPDDEDGTWWFWWPWVERIAPVSEVSIAADTVVARIAVIPRPGSRVSRATR